MSLDQTTAAPDLDFTTSASRRLRQRRMLQDKLAAGGIAVGGVSVIIAVVMIFFYLLYEVAPLFKPAQVEPWHVKGAPLAPYTVPGSQSDTLYLAVEEQAEIGFRISADGEMVFFRAAGGELIDSERLDLPEGVEISSFAVLSEASRIFAFGLSNGEIRVLRHSYKATYPDGQRVLTPHLEHPLGEAGIQVANGPIEKLAITNNGDRWGVAALSDGQINFTRLALTENLFTGETSVDRSEKQLPSLGLKPRKLLLTPDLAWLMASAADGKIAVVNLRGEPEITQLFDASEGQITSFQLLLGANSLLLGDDKGKLSQWFFVRNDQGAPELTQIRDFEHSGDAIVSLTTEQRRKGLVSVDNNGALALYNATARRTAFNEPLFDGPVGHIAMAPRSDALLVEQNGKLSYWHVENEHPEVSWSVLWEKVWYEGYDEPAFIWQSSASNNDFEPKYSLMPLAFGTLKAAFYAMLLATPLAICGAIYTAYFMVPGMRRKVKPFIELMEALPTVILGFLAGLWLAPFMEANLAGIFAALVVIPIAVVGFGFTWQNMPERIRFLLPDGWDAALLIPVVILATWFALGIAVPLEQLLFNGDLRTWLSNEAGISYDQRNALVVGIAMGFAVIPTIFSITEDAIFAVPKHLSYGSLALGATQWQTLTRVVLPTASPGIFSALMIGMGRAVGETMIVLMATGNTPIMDVNIFEGMRTLAANIAVEMPESEVGSTHFRILFLAAFVLFLFTFVVNTLAESIRQHLRKKYGSL
ncbi:phosphate ABC transporter permease [Marinobacterium zhoushanense]|uniref:Phosphate ABC transporter permease n=1 Tax=Marinobacterium zhoushanense TaxID=1679163 RepID=A0ABQ1KWV0_9GAMM|nr:ABC transporter permease subunit [Marinobacterium zhoushanense]GGC09971.1 phosphate ABC transporter permease [Marinobacterium zhoushanense]